MGAQDDKEQLGTLTPAQVIECAEGSNRVCWVQAEYVGEDGARQTYECCGGGGKKASFRLKTKLEDGKPVNPDQVPSGLTWIRRYV